MEESCKVPRDVRDTTPRPRAGWTGMLDGTKWNKALRESRLTGREDPDPVTSRLA